MKKSDHTTAGSLKRDTPLSVRVLEKFSSPVAVAMAFAVILIIGYLAGEWQTGRLQRVFNGAENSLSLRATATLFVLAAFVPVAHLYLRRWTAQHLAALRASYGEAISSVQSAPPGIGAGIVGAAAFFLLFMVIPNLAGGSPVLSFQLIAAVISGMVFGWLAGRFLVCMLKDSMQMSRLARALPDLDLLDLSPLSPFVQQGLKCTLLTMIVLVFTSHLFIAPGNTVIGSTVFLLIWIGLTLVVFTLPVLGAHERILAEKQSQLDAIRSEIRDAKMQLVDHRDGNAGNRLSALLDLESRLERVRAWPYETSTWLKLGLYVLIGLGSWLGAAAVERLLDSLL